MHRILTGDTLLTIRREFKRLPVEEADIEASLENFERMVPVFRTRVDLNLIPESKSAFDTLTLDSEGRIWVIRTREHDEVGGGSSNTFDIFDRAAAPAA